VLRGIGGVVKRVQQMLCHVLKHVDTRFSGYSEYLE